jgi:hypothetical protein
MMRRVEVIWWTTWGPRTGTCGHCHTHREAAEQCALAHRRATRALDRRAVAMDREGRLWRLVERGGLPAWDEVVR